MKTYKTTVPPTLEMCSYSSNFTGTKVKAKESALWDYNSARAKDGLDPLTKLPRGSITASIPVYYIIRHGESYGETVDYFFNKDEAKEMLREYSISDKSALFSISLKAV